MKTWFNFRSNLRHQVEIFWHLKRLERTQCCFLVQYALLQAGCFDGLFSPVIVNIDDQHFLYSFWHCQLRAGFCSPLLHFCIFTVYLSKALLCTNIVHITCNAFQMQWLLPHSLSCTAACCMRLSIILLNQTIKATPTTPAPSLVWFSYLYRLDKGTLTSTDMYCISESWMCVSTYQTNTIHWQCLDWMPCSSYIYFCCASFIYCN